MTALQKQTADSIRKLQGAMNSPTFGALKPGEQEMVREALRTAVQSQLKSKAERIY